MRAAEWLGGRVPVEGLNDARTKLADFFNSLLIQLAGDGVCLEEPSCG